MTALSELHNSIYPGESALRSKMYHVRSVMGYHGRNLALDEPT